MLILSLFRSGGGMVIWIMGVYGPPGIRGRDQFLTEMGDLFGLCGPIWCVAGDFNMA